MLRAGRRQDSGKSSADTMGCVPYPKNRATLLDTIPMRQRAGARAITHPLHKTVQSPERKLPGIIECAAEKKIAASGQQHRRRHILSGVTPVREETHNQLA